MLISSGIDEYRDSTPDDPSKIERKSTLESIITHALQAANGSLRLGENLAVAVISAEDQTAIGLHPEETRLLSPRASRRKQLTWTLGRSAARLALKSLGIDDPPPVFRGKAGEPIWPNGITGSITHCYPWSLAVATRFSDSLAIGIDLEDLDRIRQADICGLTCRDREREWVFSGNDCFARLGMVFSAKEAIYKSLYPVCQRYIDFTEVDLTWCADQCYFKAEFIPSDGRRLQGRLSIIPSRRFDHLCFSCSVYDATETTPRTCM